MQCPRDDHLTGNRKQLAEVVNIKLIRQNGGITVAKRIVYISSHARFTQDRKRHRDLVRDGWRILIFSGTEVFHHLDRCVDEVRATIDQLYGASGTGATPIAPIPSTSRIRVARRQSPPIMVISSLVILVLLCVGFAFLRDRFPGPAYPMHREKPTSAVAARSVQVMTTPTLPFEPPRPDTGLVANTPTILALHTALVQAPELNVRQAPNLDAVVVIRVKQGIQVDILAKRASERVLWAHIRVLENGSGVEGWVNAGFLH